MKHVSNLINGDSDSDEADEVIKELEQLVEATNTAERNKTLNNICNKNGSQ